VGGRALIILDTHALLWLDAGDPLLGASARRAADRAWGKNELAVSAITFWEVATLQRKGRLALSKDLESWRTQLLQAGLVEIAVTGDIGLRSADLPGFHSDPADRIIVATALREGAMLCTADRRILDWPGHLKRRDAAS